MRLRNCEFAASGAGTSDPAVLEMIVHAGADDVAGGVVSEGAGLARRAGDGDCGERGVAEVVVEILAADRPVLREHLLDAGARGPADAPAVLGARELRSALRRTDGAG